MEVGVEHEEGRREIRIGFGGEDQRGGRKWGRMGYEGDWRVYEEGMRRGSQGDGKRPATN